ncbi:MAG: DUF4249 family protein [Flavobacteriales bacterium]|nr:DUF4249 family protein [Flavobacteriales bacterium]
MKNIFTLSIALILILSFVSCDRFADGVVHEVEFPEHSPRLAVTLISGDIDSQIVAQVTSTASVLDAAGPQPVAGAVISLSLGEDAIVYTLGEEEFVDLAYKLNLDDTFGHFDATMTLNVDAPGFDPVTATNTMPPIPEVALTYEYRGDTMHSPWNGDVIQDIYTLDLVNHSDLDDSYLINVDALYIDAFTLDTLGWDQVWLRSQNDQRITEEFITGGLIVSDKNATGWTDGLADITFFSKSFDYDKEWSPVALRLRVQALSPELAKFYESTGDYLSGGFDLFAEPSLIYSNVSSGFGCFGLSSQTIVEIN